MGILGKIGGAIGGAVKGMAAGGGAMGMAGGAARSFGKGGVTKEATKKLQDKKKTMAGGRPMTGKR